MENQQNHNLNNNPNTLPQQQHFQFSQPREPNIVFTSQFDSGNMHEVVRTTYDHYSIWTASDAQGTANPGYPKSWFYFEVGGFVNRRVNFSVHRLHFLYAMVKRSHLYRPVFRIKNDEDKDFGEWGRLPHPIISLSLNNDQELVLKFDFAFVKGLKSVQFAFIYPYSYEQCRSEVIKARQEYQNDKELLLRQYELTKSYEGRIIDMLMISSHEGREGYEIIKGTLADQKIIRYRSNKPIIFISARVHPIQTPSSYTLKGIMQFLLDKKDSRAYLLRKYFVFVLVPMLNPDGVSRGHCRMDALNQNLNRYYTNPDPQKQPSCFAVKKLFQHYTKQKRLFMYLDLHAHPAYKGNFTFGNAIYQFIEQVESQLFPKVLAQNCMSFQFQQCVFSRKHMKAKDRNEQISKQGCGRVVLYKQFGLVHSYTLECGYHLNTFDNQIQIERGTQNKYLVRYRLNERGQKIYDQTQKILQQQKLIKYLEDLQFRKDDKLHKFDIFQFTSHCLDNAEDSYYKRELPTYTPQTFYNLGRNILISILDIWNKNPYSRLSDMNAYRKEIAQKQSKLDRFRKEQAGIKTKQKKIVQLIEEQFYGEWHRRNVFNNASANNPRDKKRNHTLQIQKIGLIKTLKEEKGEKLQVKQQDNNTLIHSQNLNEIDTTQSHNLNTITRQSRQEKHVSIGSDNLGQSKTYHSRNFKLSRNKLATSANQHQKECNSRGNAVNKEVVGIQMKAILQEQLIRASRHEALCVSSKVIKVPNFNAGNIRNRNMALGVLGHLLPKK